MAVYQKRGFQVETLLMDGEFRNLHPMVYAKLHTELDIVSRGDNVPDVEWYIITIKVRARGNK